MSPARRDPTSRARRWAAVLAACALLACAGFVALGTWQVERRAWKLDLIARVDARVQAPPVAAPPPERWLRLDVAAETYRHVRVAGTFLNDREVLVQAVTERGSGFWVLVPLQLADGGAVWVNRGFVPPELRERAARAASEPAGPVAVTGLLRASEPGGAFLRRNDAADNRWFSRDVAAMSVARGLGRAAPFFVDADAAGSVPVGGLTVVRFPNNHLVYALTWYALALMAAAAAWRAWRGRMDEGSSDDGRQD